jgi:hypothetical protein
MEEKGSVAGKDRVRNSPSAFLHSQRPECVSFHSPASARLFWGLGAYGEQDQNIRSTLPTMNGTPSLS